MKILELEGEIDVYDIICEFLNCFQLSPLKTRRIATARSNSKAKNIVECEVEKIF